MTPYETAALFEDQVLGKLLVFLLLAALIAWICVVDWRSLKTERDRWRTKE